ncbi:hypothetical protein [Scytonema sp. HK-05]
MNQARQQLGSAVTSAHLPTPLLNLPKHWCHFGRIQENISMVESQNICIK